MKTEGRHGHSYLVTLEVRRCQISHTHTIQDLSGAGLVLEFVAGFCQNCALECRIESKTRFKPSHDFVLP